MFGSLHLSTCLLVYLSTCLLLHSPLAIFVESGMFEAVGFSVSC